MYETVQTGAFLFTLDEAIPSLYAIRSSVSFMAGDNGETVRPMYETVQTGAFLFTLDKQFLLYMPVTEPATAPATAPTISASPAKGNSAPQQTAHSVCTLVPRKDIAQ